MDINTRARYCSFKKNKSYKKKFNLVHYDSDKSYYGRKKSYETLWFLIKKNGILISDDISDNYAFINFVKQKKLIKNKSYFILKYKNKFIGIAIKK
jgi:predicted O-methyltransferase YrrM